MDSYSGIIIEESRRSEQFSDFTPIPCKGFNILCKAKRYGSDAFSNCIVSSVNVIFCLRQLITDNDMETVSKLICFCTDQTVSDMINLMIELIQADFLELGKQCAKLLINRYPEILVSAQYILIKSGQFAVHKNDSSSCLPQYVY